jgi:hypothetical protein
MTLIVNQPEVQAQIDAALSIESAESSHDVSTSPATLNTAMPAERIAELEGKLGRKLTKQEILLERMDRHTDPNAPARSVVPYGQTPPGKFTEDEADIASFESAERNSRYHKMKPSDAAKELLAERVAADKLEAERQERLASPEVQAKVAAIKELIASSQWDARYEDQGEVDAMEFARKQIEEGDIDTGVALVDEAIALNQSKWKTQHDKILEQDAALKEQQIALAIERSRLAKLAGLPVDETVFRYETESANSEAPAEVPPAESDSNLPADAQKLIAEANAKAIAAEAKAAAAVSKQRASAMLDSLLLAALPKAAGKNPLATSQIIAERLAKNAVMDSAGNVLVEMDGKKLSPAQAVAAMEADDNYSTLFKSGNGRQVKPGASVKNVPVAPVTNEVDVTKLTWDQFKQVVKDNPERIGIRK